MKKAIILFIAVAHLALTSCSKLDSENVSRITYYPTIVLNGDQWNRVTKGGTWTDPGVVAKEGDNTLEAVVGGDAVDTNTPGAYIIKYTATNKDGFSLTAYRYVGVIDPAVEGIDLSGKYKRDAGAQGISTVTKVKENLYMTDNVGGIAAPGPSTTVYFYHYAPGLLSVPYQLVQGSPFYATNATVTVGVNYKWVVINSGYGTALRNFVKQ